MIKYEANVEVKLLRLNINDALHEPDEKTRIGKFWCVAPDYDKIFPIINKILFDKSIKKIIDANCTIERQEGGFGIKDSYGNHDTFTQDEILLFVELYKRSQNLPHKYLKNE